MRILLFLSVAIIIVGGILTLIRIFYDITPKSLKLYQLDISDLVSKLYLSIPFLILMFCTLYLVVKSIFIQSFYYSFALIIPICLALLSIPSLILFQEYFKIEKNRKIEIDPNNHRIIISDEETQIINNTDINTAEFHLSITSNKGPFDFEYMELILNDNSRIILTNLLTELTNFESILKGVKRKYHKRRIYNKINRG